MLDINNMALTHGGKFHADDVFSAALLKKINPSIRIVRTFEVPKEFDGIAFDIGYGRYDHHQENAELRDNGVPYASFGLLWRDFGEALLTGVGCLPAQAAEEAARFDEGFIQSLDNSDNTGCENPLAGVISDFNPSWDSSESPDQRFEEAVNFAMTVLNRKFDNMLSVHRARALVETALAESKDNIVILPRFAPWRKVLVPSNAVFVVYPSQRGGYSAQVIPEDSETKAPKCDFPEEWAGKREDELPRISGIPTLSFCHRGRFLISAGNLDDVIKACKLAQKKSRKV